MAISQERASQALNDVVRRAIRRDRGDYGYGEDVERDIYSVLVNPHIHDFRLLEMPELCGEPSLFQSHRSLLDLGCGTAPLVFRALEQGLNAYGIDTDFEKITIAHLKVAASGYPAEWTQRVVRASAYELPFADKTFDIVTSFQVLEHLDDLNSALYEAVRVTKPGGWIVFRAPDYRMSFEPHYRIPWLQFAPPRLAERWLMAMGRPPGGLGTFFYITLPQVQSILETLGCSIRTAQLYTAVQGRYAPISAPVGPEHSVISTDADIAQHASTLQQQAANGTLAAEYCTELSFAIAARRL